MRGLPPRYASLFTLSIFSNFNYLFYGLFGSEVILKELGHLSFSVNSEVSTRVEPLIYAIKTYEYRSSLRKLIREIRIIFTKENVCKN